MDKTTQQAWYLWAKSDRDTADGRYLPILTHLIDVAACAWEILEREPLHTGELFAADYGLDEESARRWVCVLVGLHDLGKASPTFQALWNMAEKRPLGGVERLIPRAKQEKEIPHGQVTHLLLPAILECMDWPNADAVKVGDAVGCHHGRRSTPKDVDGITDFFVGANDWNDARQALFELVFMALGLVLETVPAPTLPFSSPAFMRLAGLTSFADWVGSSFEVPSAVDPLPIEDPAAYFEKAKAKAREKLDAIGWTKREPLQQHVQSPAEMFSYIPSFVPRSLQTQLAEWLPTLEAKPTLILVEAPMGEGKTEAGLHAATWLQSKVGHRGFYIALPTMATGNAMYTRFGKFLDRAAAGRGIVPDLQLLHGGTLLNKDYQAALHHTRNPKADPETAEEEKLNVRAESWFSVRKRANLSEYSVGTVDQALLGVLGVPHQFVRLWGLGNRVVILDEIHAYDTYTSELIFTLIRWLRALGSSVILMSATLPARSRRELLRAWGSEDEAGTDYPRLTIAQEGKAETQHIVGSRTQTPLTVRALGAEVQEVAAKALELAEGGGNVAVIVNTVQRAQDIFGAIEASYVGHLKTLHRKGKSSDLCLMLFHARYPAHARQKREEAVTKYLGPQPYQNGKDYRPQRMILIATQVAEQSLDFDADVMLTDLAPIDLMLQRSGRLHRHAAQNRERRHAHAEPHLWIAGLSEWPTEAITRQHWQHVYAPYLLYRSWLGLREGQTVQLPADLDTLVQRVYGEEAWYSLSAEQEAELAEAKVEFDRRYGNESSLGRMAHIGNPDNFFGVYPHIEPEPDGEPVHDDADDEEWPQTRLGEESIRIVPVFRQRAKWLLDPANEHSVPCLSNSGKVPSEKSREIFTHSLQVAKQQVVHGAKDAAAEAGLHYGAWQEDPLLRDCVPLPFIDGVAQVQARGGLRLRLDPELGLVYEKLS